MQVRTGVRGLVATAAAVGLVAVGATAVAATGSTTSPTGLCLADGAPATTAKADGSGGFSCPAGRSLVVLAADGALQELRGAVGGLFGQVDDLRTQGWDTNQRVGVVENDVISLQERAASAESSVFALQQDLGSTQQQLDEARSQLATARDTLAALQRRTALSTLSVPLAFSGSGAVARTVSCDGGSALSGSVRTDGARVLQSAVTDNGAGWAFEVEPSSKAPAATLLVVCAGRTVSPGGVTPGAPTAPGTSTPTSP